MAEAADARRLTLSTLTLKTVVVHTVTYFVAGVLAYTLGDYATAYSQPPLSYFMRPTSDRIVIAGPLFQPIRGVVFALALYPLRAVIFGARGWLIVWWLLVAIGILSTFGPAPGSIEGMVYTIIPALDQVGGLWETLLQSLLLAVILVHWVRHPGRAWLTWTLGVAFCLVVALSLLGLLAGPA